MKTDVSGVCKANLLEASTYRPQAFDSAQKKVFFKAMRKLGLLAKLYETIIMKIALCFFVWLAKSHFLVALLVLIFRKDYVRWRVMS